MFTKLNKTVVAATLAIQFFGGLSGAYANILLSADNKNSGDIAGTSTSTWTIGPNNETVLNFKTTKPKELVEVEFSMLCGGILLDPNQSVASISVSFVIDGVTQSANPIPLCLYNRINGGLNNSIDLDVNGIARQGITVATAGTHSIQVQLVSDVQGITNAYVGNASTTIMN
jgi:hypothetical protein